ncbi:MAG TPA: DUF3179 domain-containing protein, partial [Bacteroidetes bacterium]|nr:DUF3179 domain-containing protein [Bacteroidota bacterium]
MRNTILLLLGILIFTQCTSRKQPPTPETGDGWLIPVEDIANLGVSPDPIKSIDHPVFIPLAQSDLKGSEPVYVLKLDNVIKVYPLSILQAHEIVNDSVSGNYFAVTYCPVTASGLLWNRKIRGVVTEFGVSGMLYHENLMPYDRRTKSYWSQMRMDCVHGEYIGERAVTGFLLRTTLETVRNSFPYARILTDNNGQKGFINRKYNKLQQMIPEYFG